MFLVILYSILLISGMVCSQAVNLSSIKPGLDLITKICLAYIMIGVGLEFIIDKKRLKNYGFDFLFAFLAAALPWILCAVYFAMVFKTNWNHALLIGVFAAPTSAGVLFAMLAAAGLKKTWVFQKAQVLAVFDDFDAILLLIPLQIAFIGLRPELFVVVAGILALLSTAYFKLNSWKTPHGQGWMVFYSIMMVTLVELVKAYGQIDLGVLLPSFVLGAVIYYEHNAINGDRPFLFDQIIKALFIFLVGCSLPKMAVAHVNAGILACHVAALTVLSNLGKCFLFFCYKKEAGWKDRLALSVAMFPRGEVGAGVLFIALGYGLEGVAMNAAGLSLGLNLCLTGLFIMIVKRLQKA
ncbi:MAG: cation:proton antiporter [Candidatus Omnitrophica bacterium]|nr:cation:proton antiporter [Candidatus Omnitrophota bacterium]